MDIVNLLPIIALATSAFAAAMSSFSVKKRLSAEKELHKKLNEQLHRHRMLLELLQDSKNSQEVLERYETHKKKYDKLVSAAYKSLDDEAKKQIASAIHQDSEHGRDRYISKTIRNSILHQKMA